MARKIIHPDPKTETESQEFDSANYFKEAMALRKPLQPVIKKVTVIAEVRVGRPLRKWSAMSIRERDNRASPRIAAYYGWPRP
jgi:hypothetical protein